MTTLAERQKIIHYIDEGIAQGARQNEICRLIGLSSRTLQRWRADAQQEQAKGDRRTQRIQTPRNALSEAETGQVIALLNSPQYAHLPPTQIVPMLADQGIYLASESTMYRILRRLKQLTHRRSERPARTQEKPRALSANKPNQLYSWDITYLPTNIKGKHYYLYLFLDIFSRNIVGWQVYDSESSDRAAEVMRDICEREQIEPQQVTLHSDNGSPMKGATMLATLQSLGVTPSFSRPAVSNDNPYSESLFKTCKYRPNYPKVGFENLMEARTWVGRFIQWYNQEHRHSSINFVTPAQRHRGEDCLILKRRKEVLEAARKAHPDRWSRGTRNCDAVSVVYLNPNQTIKQKSEETTATKAA